jgi:hypothetical protein
MKNLAIIRWTGRITASLVIAFVLFFLFSELIGTEKTDYQSLPINDKIAFVFFPLSTLIGLSVAWKWEGLGGLITILGLIGLLIIRPDLLSNFFLVGLIAVPGLLFIFYWYLARGSVSSQ